MRLCIVTGLIFPETLGLINHQLLRTLLSLCDVHIVAIPIFCSTQSYTCVYPTPRAPTSSRLCDLIQLSLCTNILPNSHFLPRSAPSESQHPTQNCTVCRLAIAFHGVNRGSSATSWQVYPPRRCVPRLTLLAQTDMHAADRLPLGCAGLPTSRLRTPTLMARPSPRLHEDMRRFP